MTNSLSIIIPTLNEEYYLPILLTSITKQDFKGKLQVVVVDGKSSDATRQVARKFLGRIEDLLVVTVEKGISHQRNVGAAKAKYELLVFLDADMILPKHFLTKLSNNVSPDKRFVGLPIIIPSTINVFDYLTAGTIYLFVLFTRWLKPLVGGLCLITTRANHKKIKGFDEKVMFAEDFNYGIRSKAAGAKYHIFPTLFLYTSVRRARELGRVRMLFLLFQWYIITARHGKISDTKRFDYRYKFGHFTRNV